jgi:hypothetical protein
MPTLSEQPPDVDRSAPAGAAPWEPWGWNRRQRIGLGILLLLFLGFLTIQYIRRPLRLGDPGPTIEQNKQNAVELPARIDPNMATLPDLSRIPHLGEALAGKIIAYREARTATAPDGIVFRQPADLDAVPGIGKKLIEQLTPFLMFPDDATATEPG